MMNNEMKRLLLKMRYLPNSPITGENLEILAETYDSILGDLPIETVEAAARQYLSTDTFFPTAGKLRETAMDLAMLAAGIPTPAEAWGMVLTAKLITEAIFCKEGARLRDECNGKAGGQYMTAVARYGSHMDECDICNPGGYNEKYGHPAVTETVRILGGRDAIMTDNPVSDRKQFIDAYREVIARERMKKAMVPEVREFVQEQRAQLIGEQIKQLAEGKSR